MLELASIDREVAFVEFDFTEPWTFITPLLEPLRQIPGSPEQLLLGTGYPERPAVVSTAFSG